MPTYEYECSSCRHAWDLFQSIKADPERKCPKCGRMTARRKIGIGAAILSGGRSADAQEPSAAAGTTGTAGTTPAKDGTKSAPGDSTSAPSGTASTPAPTPAPAQSSERGTLNSTHPARDGRGAGNLRDAIRRQRGDPRTASPASGTRSTSKPAGRTPAKPSANRSPGARRGGRSR
jgi:putative FmdB family regulatory protein